MKYIGRALWALAFLSLLSSSRHFFMDGRWGWGVMASVLVGLFALGAVWLRDGGLRSDVVWTAALIVYGIILVFSSDDRGGHVLGCAAFFAAGALGAATIISSAVSRAIDKPAPKATLLVRTRSDLDYIHGSPGQIAYAWDDGHEYWWSIDANGWVQNIRINPN